MFRNRRLCPAPLVRFTTAVIRWHRVGFQVYWRWKPRYVARVAKKLKLQERRAVIPSRRSLAACRPLGFLGRLRAPSRIGEHTRGTYGVGTYPGLHHWDGGPGAAAAERVSGC